MRRTEHERGGPLTRNLQWWLHHVTHEGNHDNVLRWLLFKLRGSKFSMRVAMIAVTVTLVNALTAENLNRADVSIRYFVGVNACICLQLMFINREDLLRRWLGLVIVHAHSAETDPATDDEFMALLARRARKGRFMRWFFVVHATATEVTFVYTLSIWAPTWLQQGIGNKEIWKEWMRWTVLTLQAYGLLAGLASVYTFLPLVLQITMASADLMYILGKKLEVCRCSRTIAATESALISACLLSDECVSDVIAPVIFASLLMPLISLVQALSGVVDSLDALGTAPLFITITVPLYLAGDMLASARQGIADSAARGPWLEEEPWQRRMRAAVMLGASGEGALPRCQGLGKLNRRGLLHVLQSWFSFLQAMLNLRKGVKVTASRNNS
ncbi:uncharacterized protein LOC127749331 [Frankliniella occidentalis]|uniref:Uncharacterized protein LOC127749331 n=1 Tax=Frankliniella occidentalis TaxID=133901 RepID=A0A9C6U0H3_FRAOC|nr:uncharacterized protein LOC127749331 [Frankliniella occidentalis]